MTAPEKLAERLRNVYIKELSEALREPVPQSLHATQIRAMVHRADDGDPILYEEPDERTWLWSDLHLGHDFSISAFNRPFRTARAADKAMHRAWIGRAADGDTTICLGDVTVDGCLQPHHVMRWRQAPGAKLLVLGNHDVDPINRIKLLEIQRTALALAAPGDPPLLLTHIPLLQVPHGAVNVHGHIHEKNAPTSNRHINVSVEQLDYAPANLKDIRLLARRLLEGRNVPAWEDTRRQIDVVNDGMTHFRFPPRTRERNRKRRAPPSRPEIAEPAEKPRLARPAAERSTPPLQSSPVEARSGNGRVGSTEVSQRRDGDIDPGIAGAVAHLQAAGIETFESCEGGPGHAFHEPTVRFHGQPGAGFHALGVAMDHGWPVASLRRTWAYVDGELNGPYWEMTFWAHVPAVGSVASVDNSRTSPSPQYPADESSARCCCPRCTQYRRGTHDSAQSATAQPES